MTMTSQSNICLTTGCKSHGILVCAQHIYLASSCSYSRTHSISPPRSHLPVCHVVHCYGVPFFSSKVSEQCLKFNKLRAISSALFATRFPGIHSLPDAGELLWGNKGRIVFDIAQLLFCVLLAGIHIILGSYAFSVFGWQ